MDIVDFGEEHIRPAMLLAVKGLCAERRHVPSLPECDIGQIPDLIGFSNNKLGTVALEGDHMLGYLCAVNPFNAFNTGVCGTFSPIHANAVDISLTSEKRRRIFGLIYQKSAEKWVRSGILSHAISLYAHDSDAISAMFTLGFGLRRIDAVTAIDGLTEAIYTDNNISFRELDKIEISIIRPLRELLSMHLGKSPCFMFSTPEEYINWLERAEKRDSIIIAAFNENCPVAFIEITNDGENFITETDVMKNICGAYCLPEYRGKGLMQALLSYISKRLAGEGIKYLGVDYESINPTAARFWPKTFIPYTNSLVRRIDESALRSRKDI